MRTLIVLALANMLATAALAQVTLVREAPNDSFNLSEPGTLLQVKDIAITRGQHAIPMDMQKPVSVNLLMWRYYDDILKKEVLMANEPFWTKGIQLIDEVPETAMLSLHLNLTWSDTSGQAHRLYLVLAGITKKDMASLPVETIFDPDTYAPYRFAAVAQIVKGEDDWETYDCLEGMCSLKMLDPKKRSISGSFEFTANRIGMEKLGFFLNGVFTK